MAIRTSHALVAGIIEIDVTISTDIEAGFITPASAIVDEVCDVNDADGNPVYDSTRLELIERWLSAHFYAIRDPRAVMEKAGPVSATYESKVDLGFDVTRYGQTAMRLDTNGGLASLNEKTKKGKGKTITFWAGTEAE